MLQNTVKYLNNWLEKYLGFSLSLHSAGEATSARKSFL